MCHHCLVPQLVVSDIKNLSTIVFSLVVCKWKFWLRTIGIKLLFVVVVLLGLFTLLNSRKSVPANCPDASETGVTFSDVHSALIWRIEKTRISGQKRVISNPDKVTNCDSFFFLFACLFLRQLLGETFRIKVL